MLNEQDIWFWLHTRCRLCKRIVHASRIVPLLIRCKVVAPTDTQAIAASARETARYIAASAAGACARLSGAPCEPPHLLGTLEYRAWRHGWRDPRIAQHAGNMGMDREGSGRGN